MSKKLLFFSLWYLFFICGFLNAEIIDSRKVTTRKFDAWTVSCEDDEMFSKIKCRMFVEITNGTTLFVNPNSTNNKLLFVSTDIFPETKVYIKIDNSNLLDSETYAQNKYNFLKFNPISLNIFYNQMRIGENFFIRFTIKDRMTSDGYKEITVKVSLAEFQKAFSFFLNQRNKYDNNKK